MLISGNYEKVCSYPNWYPLFKDISLESVIIPISDVICDYLLEDSTLVLPQEVYEKVKNISFVNQEGECLDEYDTENDTSEIKQPSFPEFSCALKEAISKLGGEVFVKLNWSAPVDAAWITANKSLKCTSIEDIYLLLKSSDVLAKELSHIKQTQSSSGVQGCIVIKRWCDIYPGHEFRCFVIRHKLVAISQRDYKTYYGYLSQNKFAIIEDIERYFKEMIRGKYLSDSYTFDIVRHSSNRIKVIDFGAFDTQKNSLLFSWSELREIENMNDDDINAPEFRFLGEDPGFQPRPYQHYGLPQDLEMLYSRDRSSVVDQIIKEIDSQGSTEQASTEDPSKSEDQPK